MKKSKQSNYLKVVAFVLIAIVIISTLGFVANGWQPILNPEDNGENDSVANAPEGNGDTDIPVATLPVYYNYLTGLETDEDGAMRKPIAFVTDPQKTVYGIGGASLSVEFPIEDSESRLLIFTDKATSLGKIGQIKPTRGYISNLVKYFGGVLLSNGNEDIINYDSLVISDSHVDLSDLEGFHYTEGKTAYTNGDLLQAALNSLGIAPHFGISPKLPFNFAVIDTADNSPGTPCNQVLIPINTDNTTELKYNASNGRYTYIKDGIQMTDALTTSVVEYDNAFILLTDSVTHESAAGTSLVMKTNESGRGFYITGGAYTEIKWVAEGNTMTFYDTNDNKLTVNRGSSYIAFTKSVNSQNIIFSR